MFWPQVHAEPRHPQLLLASGVELRKLGDGRRLPQQPRPVEAPLLNGVERGGVYSTTVLLPGESPGEFKKHQNYVIDEFRPNGPVEHDIVLTIARLLWRKQNLASFETAKLVNLRYRQIL